MDKYSVIDIGTNSMRLLTATVDQNRIVGREKHLITTRMGKGVDKTGMLGQAVIEKNLQALEQLMEISKRNQSKELLVFGTSALRDAVNSKVFTDKAKEKLGLSISVIEGKMEAFFGFLGVSSQFKESEVMIVDVGGGSTELTLSLNGSIKETTSLNVGAVRFKERYIKCDPPSEFEVKMMREQVKSMLIKERFDDGDFDVIGIGGTATTLATINLKLQQYLPDEVHNSRIKLSEVHEMIKMLSSMRDEDRKKVVGLSPKRSDIIVPGAIIVEEILKFYGKDDLIVSDYDNLEGALIYYLKTTTV